MKRSLVISCGGEKDADTSKELTVSKGYIRNQLVESRDKLGLRNSKELAVRGAKWECRTFAGFC